MHHICSEILKRLYNFFLSQIITKLNWRGTEWGVKNETMIWNMNGKSYIVRKFKDCHGARQMKKRHSDWKGMKYKGFFFFKTFTSLLWSVLKRSGTEFGKRLWIVKEVKVLWLDQLFPSKGKQIASCFKDFLTGKCGSAEHGIQWTGDDRKKGMVVREE